MTVTTTGAASLSDEELTTVAKRCMAHFAEVVTELETAKERLRKVQQHVVTVDAVNQAQAKEIEDLRLELRRRAASHAGLAARCDQLQQQLDDTQQRATEAKPTRTSPLSRRIGNRL